MKMATLDKANGLALSTRATLGCRLWGCDERSVNVVCPHVQRPFLDCCHFQLLWRANSTWTIYKTQQVQKGEENKTLTIMRTCRGNRKKRRALERMGKAKNRRTNGDQSDEEEGGKKQRMGRNEKIGVIKGKLTME